MKRTSIWILLGSLALGFGGACGKASSSHQLGGETHWLESCNENSSAECGPNLECVCGVCTVGCSTDASCSGVSSEARCAPREMTAYDADCQSTAPERLCVRRDDPDEGMGNDRIPLRGRPYVEAGNCFGASEVIGSRPSPRLADCAADAIRAKDAAGNCWLIQDCFLPDGFVALGQFDEFESCARTSATCQNSQSCDEGEVATVEGCLACNAAETALVNGAIQLLNDLGFDACSSDLDCVAQGWQTGCNGMCPLAVNTSSVGSVESELATFSSGYCSPSEWIDTCGQSIVDCNIVPICRAGRCVISGDLACADRLLQGCEDDGDCAQARASRYVPESQCFQNGTVPVACVDPDLSCPPTVTAGLDGDGNCYAFGGCLPAGFTRAPEGHECVAALSTTCQ